MPVLPKGKKTGKTRTRIYNDLFLSIVWLIIIALFVPKIMKAGHDVELIWTAPGDDNNWGQGTLYDIRYSSVPIGFDTLNWWHSAIRVDSVPEPSPAGHQDSCLVRNLVIDSSFYFAIKTSDEAHNWSDISNIVEIPPLFCMDITGDDLINILDAIYLLNYLYKNDDLSLSLETGGDVDSSGDINILDAVFIIYFCYKDGPPPDCRH